MRTVGKVMVSGILTLVFSAWWFEVGHAFVAPGDTYFKIAWDTDKPKGGDSTIDASGTIDWKNSAWVSEEKTVTVVALSVDGSFAASCVANLSSTATTWSVKLTDLPAGSYLVYAYATYLADPDTIKVDTGSAVTVAVGPKIPPKVSGGKITFDTAKMKTTKEFIYVWAHVKTLPGYTIKGKITY